jgi:hypothetical protein
MNPNTRFALTALAALGMASSSLMACLRGDLDLTAAGFRYVIAFVVAHIGIGLVDQLLTGYRRGAATAAAAAEAASFPTVVTPVERAGHPLRRDADLTEHGILEVSAD